MQRLLNYKLFIETYTVPQNAPPEIASDMSSFNDLEGNIKEFNAKKSILDNIYMTYTDEKDLINKLSSQKFIDNTTDKTKIKFHNPLLGLWAQSSEKNKELKDLQDKINDDNKSILDKTASLSKNPTLKDAINKEIESLKNSIVEKNKLLSQIKTGVGNLQKSTQDKIKQMSGEYSQSKNRIDTNNLILKK